MRNRIVLLLLSVLLAGGSMWLAGCKRTGKDHEGHSAAEARQQYHCPMHPTFVADKPGDCPICGMKLVPIQEEKAKPASTADPFPQVKIGQYYCPMGAEHVQDKPGICPKCGMNLIEKKESPPGHVGRQSSEAEAPVPGRVGIRLSADKRQTIGLALSKVEKRKLTRNIRATAVVMHDETRYARIAPRFGGWLRKLHVSFTGAPVEKGQPLFAVYSPELYSAENEYLMAWRGLGHLDTDAPEEQRVTATNLWGSARRRLELWEIGGEEIRAMEERGAASDEVLFRSPIAGHVVTKTAVEGKAFMAGESLYEVADLSHLWLDAWVFESDLPLIKVGLTGTVTFPYLGNKAFAAAITFLYPHIDPRTRRGRVRLELDNPDRLLRPDMWASVGIDVPLGEKLLIPASAVIDTGQRFVAFVDAEDEHLQPRELKMGLRAQDDYEVLSGVKEGEQVVTRALFLVDSESQLKAAIAGMGEAGEHRH